MSVNGVIGGVVRPVVRSPILLKGVGASQYASGPAPAGFRWDFVTESGVRVTDGGVPVVDMVRIS